MHLNSARNTKLANVREGEEDQDLEMNKRICQKCGKGRGRKEQMRSAICWSAVGYGLAKGEEKCVVEKAPGAGAAQQVQLKRLSSDQQGGSKSVSLEFQNLWGFLKKHLDWRDISQLIKNQSYSHKDLISRPRSHILKSWVMVFAGNSILALGRWRQITLEFTGQPE